MNMIIRKKISVFLDNHPKTSHWAWFIILWCAGLLSALTLSMPIKFLIKMASAHR